MSATVTTGDCLELLEQHMQLPWHIRADLRAATAAMTNTDGAVPAATL